jgi:maleylacetate reductase
MNPPFKSFIYASLPCRVVFGAGCLSSVAAESLNLGMHRALVLSSAGQVALAQRVAGLLGERTTDVYAKAAMHVPMAVAQEAIDLA